MEANNPFYNEVLSLPYLGNIGETESDSESNGKVMNDMPSTEVEAECETNDDKKAVEKMPTVPPVLKTFVRIAPESHKLAVINAFMPLMAMSATYLTADYIDGDEHMPLFYHCSVGPAASGKSYVKKIRNILLTKIRQRDLLGKVRLSLYNREKKTKDIKFPPLQIREMADKISESQMMMEMSNLKGRSALIFAAEIDTFLKGKSVAGGDKSDMFRIAFDRDTYSQRYILSDTFSGDSILAFNIVITGTNNQMAKAFKNVEDGLVTRFSFSKFEDEFASIPIWGKITKEEQDDIESVLDFCDSQTYMEPLVYNPENLAEVPNNQFDNLVPYKYKFRPFYKVDLSWSFETLSNWLEEQRLLAAKNLDHARDTFRKRVAVKGFRFILLCYALYKHEVGEKEKKEILTFTEWWMNQELQTELELFGAKYNKVVSGNSFTQIPKISVFEMLNDIFTIEDLTDACNRIGIKTPPRNITSQWNKIGIVKIIDKAKKWEKVK